MRRVAVGKVSPQFQLTVKEEVRRILGLQAGDLVAFYETGDGSLLITKVEIVPACATS
ncbi:MAG: AbrB/MazE/SpoVT family DNA-binding domain-containing protein [Methanoregulaceae archaeon]|nr:AbrB/MazE/SpoVT family DNA-binding domain-containing protein [Methanoregulaceae archaeon]